MVDFYRELDKIKNQIISSYNPSKIILFGSLAKGTWRKNSDIDLCIIKNSDNKRELIADIYLNINSEVPFDILVYTEEEWALCVKDTTSFAYLIDSKGVVLYG